MDGHSSQLHEAFLSLSLSLGSDVCAIDDDDDAPDLTAALPFLFLLYYAVPVCA